MGFRHCLIVLTAATALLGQQAAKKPVTLDSLGAAARGGGRFGGPGAGIWAPDGKSFAFREGAKIKIYDVASKTSRDVLATKALDDAAAKPDAPPPEFDWTNRRVNEGG